METLTLFTLTFVSLAVPLFCTEIYVDPPSFHEFLKTGDAMKLTCNSKFQEDYELVWTTPNGNSQVGSGFKITSVFTFDADTNPRNIVGIKAELEVFKYTPELSGDYKCELKNKTDGTVLTDYEVSIHTIHREGEDVMFHPDNKTITLTCKISVEGAKIGEPVWSKGDTLITDLASSGGAINANGENLTIIDVMRSDAGLYVAEYPIEIKEDSLTYKCKVAIQADPLVKDFEKSKNLIQEDDLKLQCKVLGYPLPEVTWFKDGVQVLVNGSKRVTLEDLNGVKNATLIVKDVDYDDGGDYKCMAKSNALKSNSSKTITVRVKDKFAALWPFLGIVGEVIVLCTIIFIYEKRRSRQAEQEEAAQEEPEQLKKGNVRNRRHQK